MNTHVVGFAYSICSSADVSVGAIKHNKTGPTEFPIATGLFGVRFSAGMITFFGFYSILESNTPPIPSMGVKISALVNNVPTSLTYNDTFGRDYINGTSRLRVTVGSSQIKYVSTLLEFLLGPFKILYVLHTTRTAGALGRYESPELTRAEVNGFLSRFHRFLEQDARHDLWIKSKEDDGLIVLDRHNVMFAYGSFDTFESALRQLGLHKGTPALVPSPHAHHYHPEFDDAEREMLTYFNWQRTPLRAGDIQDDATAKPSEPISDS